MVVKPGRVRRRIAHMKIERLLSRMLFQKRNGVIRDDIRDITRFIDQTALSVKRSTIIRASARFVRKPVCKTLLRYRTLPQVPFAGQASHVSFLCQDVGIGSLTCKIFYILLFFIIVANPVVNAVLRRNSPRQK